ncbi:hypothetical protein ACVIWV_002797 [Bradyrhizobium diazoefficiens]|uniref:Uncharacterized protein n=1 Tax=Bradyrhizobium japonicum TaxID=375 RepID=A0ABV2RJT2_BRAJP|nr:hypothetical protein [Bradyrhizobium japonicum]MCS3892055.1 hypothetical protein [Bradyrhizobium japonicum USDA 38]MCS3944570.1 hypothetical protein [Bradyrhizobium japonicum]
MFCSEILCFEKSPQCSIALRWPSTTKDRTLAARSNTSVSGGNRTLVSTSDMIE